MRKNKHGYVPAAIMVNNMINEMRDHVEYEKFVARTVADNKITRKFKRNTDEHPNSKYRLLYNSEAVNEHTVAGKKEKQDADR